MATGLYAPDTFPATETEAGDVTAQPAVAPGQVSRFIAWFDHVSREDVARVGGKGANLGELTAAGLPVPPGFVIMADAYLDALDRAGERDELQRRVEGLDVDDADALGAAA